MESKDRRQIRAILDGSPRSTVRMYELCDMLGEDRIHCYVNGSAVLFVAWAVMLWAKNKEDLVPLLSRIPADRGEVELFCVENRFISLLENHVAPVTISAECLTWSMDRVLVKLQRLTLLPWRTHNSSTTTGTTKARILKNSLDIASSPFPHPAFAISRDSLLLWLSVTDNLLAT